MIIQFKVKNFLSFKGEVTFDLISTNDKKFKEYGTKKTKKDSILNFSVIYGPNASGKSNLLKAFGTLKDLIFFNTNDKDQRINHVVPFLLDETSKDKNTEFEIVFYCNETKYIYHLEINKNEFVYEFLNIYLTNRPSLVFERKTENGISKIEFGNIIKIEPAIKKEMEAKCLKNISVFMAYKQVNFNIEYIDDVIKWFSEKYIYIEPRIYEKFTYIPRKLVIGKIINDDKNFKDKLLDFLRYADINISDLIPEKREIELDENIINLFQKNNLSNLIVDKKLNYYDIKYSHKISIEGIEKEYILPEELQSQGTLNFLDLVSILFYPDTDRVLFIDEIENSIHPLVLKYIITKFIREKTDSQLIVTTHYDGLLECDDTIRKDSIWFTSKREDGSTELYSLIEFNGLNRLSSLKKAYEYGKFGAIPDIKEL